MKFTVNLTHAPVGATDFWEYESRDLALAHITALLVADPKLLVTETSETKFSPEARTVETTFTLERIERPAPTAQSLRGLVLIIERLRARTIMMTRERRLRRFGDDSCIVECTRQLQDSLVEASRDCPICGGALLCDACRMDEPHADCVPR